MQKQTLNRIGLAAVILLAPGGFVLGATLATRHYRDRARRKAEEAAEANDSAAKTIIEQKDAPAQE